MMLSCVTALEAHLARAHRDLQQKPAVCDRCGKCYTYSYTLKRHKWKCLGLRHLECEICGRVNHRLDYHKAHMLRVHGLTVLQRPLIISFHSLAALLIELNGALPEADTGLDSVFVLSYYMDCFICTVTFWSSTADGPFQFLLLCQVSKMECIRIYCFQKLLQCETIFSTSFVSTNKKLPLCFISIM